MKYTPVAVAMLLGSTKGQYVEYLEGAGPCTPGAQFTTLYTDADCTIAAADQSFSTNWDAATDA